MLDNNVNQNKYNQQFQALSQQQAQLAPMQPSMQAVDPALLNQTVQDSYVSNRLKASNDSNPVATAAVGAGIWYGIAQAMDKFGPKCEGEYNKTILGKIGGWGDRFTKNTAVGRKLDQFANWVSTKFDKLAGKSKIAYTLKHHSTQPEWSFAKTPGAGIHGFLAMDTQQIFDDFVSKPIKNVQKLEQYGASQDAINKFAKTLSGKTPLERNLLLQREELKYLGMSKDAIANLEKNGGIQKLIEVATELKAKKLGFDDLAHFNRLKGKYLENADEIMKILEKGSKNNIKISIWRTQNKIVNHLFGRTCSLSEYLNKYKAALGKGNETRLGRALSKAFCYLTEGCTNRFAGGKLAVAMQAAIFADMAVHAWNAPKGEKGKTLAERFVNDFTYFAAMTVGIMGMHKVGGFKYAGLDKEGVKAYREALEVFNQNVKNKVFKSKFEYNTAKNALKTKLGTKNIKNPITKLLQKVGSFLNIGNERMLSYRSNSKNNMNFLRKLANGNIIGVPMRVIIPLMVVSPFLAKLTTKACHAIFGKPTKSVLDEDKEQEQQQNQVNPTQTQIPPQLQNPQIAQQNQIPQQTNSPNQQGNLINQYQQTQQSGIPQQQNIPQQGIPQQPLQKSDTNLLEKYKNGQPTQSVISKPNEPVRTYIPSPVGVQLTQGEDISPAEVAMQRADIAEQEALKALKMN